MSSNPSLLWSRRATPPGIVSMRCFCGVGEFCKTKSIPCGSFASNNDAPVAAVAAIARRIPAAADNRLNVPKVPDISKLVPQCNPSVKKLEQDFQCKLNETRIGSRSDTRDYAKICIV